MSFPLRAAARYCMGILAAVWLCSGVLKAAEHRHILVIHSYEAEYNVYPEFNRELMRSFRKRGIEPHFRFFYLDCEQYGERLENDRIRRMLDTMDAWRPDLILVFDDQATYALLAGRHPMSFHVPVVFAGVNFPNWPLIREHRNVTGFWDRPDYLKTIHMIEAFFGESRILYYSDKTQLGRMVMKGLVEQLTGSDVAFDTEAKTIYDLIALDQKTGDSLLSRPPSRVWPRNRVTRPERTILMNASVRDVNGAQLLWFLNSMVRYSAHMQTKRDFTTFRLGTIANAPTFTTINEGFGNKEGIVGGYITSNRVELALAVDRACEVLGGKSPEDLFITETPKEYMLDWNEMVRWGIDPARVPASYRIVNMPFLVRYRTPAILVSVLAGLLILASIGYLLWLYHRENLRKRAAQLNLRQEKEFLSLALEGGNIYAWRWDSKADVFLFDDDFFSSLAIPPRTFTRAKLLRIIHPDDRNGVRKKFIGILEGSVHKVRIQFRIDFDGKGYQWWEFRYTSSELGAGADTSGVVGLCLNVQDFKDRERELTQARDLAAKAELKQSFLANMSHEIRTPLNAIVGFSNLLVSEGDADGVQRKEFVSIINKNCEQLLKLIDDILLVSRIESGQMHFTMEECDLKELLEGVVMTARLIVPEGVELRSELPDESMPMITDRQRLTQVVTNFLNNAVKFTSHGHITVGCKRTDRGIRIWVEDTGKGISLEEQRIIFNRFYKHDEFAQGTGLGLSICQAITDKLGGRICLESEPGAGSCFAIEFGTSSPEDRSGAPARKKDECETGSDVGPRRTRPMVLIAEDNDSNYKLLQVVLQGDYDLIRVTDGRQAVDLVRSNHSVCLVIMDIRMPNMDGIEAVKEIRTFDRKIPILMQTAHAFESDRKRSMEAGATGFVTKPIDRAELLRLVRETIGQRKD